MANTLFEVTVLNGSTPITLRMASAAATAAGCHLNNYSWTPLITKRHSIAGSWADTGILQQGAVNHGSLSFRMSSAYENEVWSSYEWTGGLARIFVQTGDEGDFSTYKQVFEGSVSSLDRDGINATVGLLGPDALLDRNLLSLEYKGTGGAEGPAALKGKLKPRAFGFCQSVEPTLVDAAGWIYQVHGYGAVASIKPYEFAQALDPAKNKGDAADFFSLKALTLVPGEWATCLALGMFRIGGTPSQKVSADVSPGGASTVATILTQLLTLAGIPTAKQGSFAPFSTAGWNLYATEQATVGEVARSAVYQAGGVLFADGTGKWQVMDYYARATTIVLNADRSTAPLVKTIRELTAAPPVWKVRVGYDRCWSVHSSSDVSPALSDASDAAVANADAARAASEAARLAQADATVAKQRLDAIASDGVLSRDEKADLVQRFGIATAERPGILGKGSDYNITTERSNYDSAYTSLKTYLEGLSPSYTDSGQDTNINRTDFDTAWKNYHLARQNLLNAIDGKAGTLATWGGVSGTGKPEDNATVGAPVGTNVGGVEAGTLVHTTNTANSNANTALNALKDKNGVVTGIQTVIDSVAAEVTRAKQEVADTRTSLNTDIAAAKQEGTTARNDLAAAKTSLGTDIAAAKQEGTTARNDLASEVTRAKGAEGAITTNVTNLKTTVDGQATTIRDNFTTLTNADTALANRSSVMESKAGGNGAISVNPTFAQYANTTGTPDGWTYDNQTNGGATRVAGETGGYAVQLASSANTSAYAGQQLPGVAANSYWVIEADVKLNVGTLSGAGVLFRAGPDYRIVFSTDKDNTDTVVGAGTVGQTYRFRKLVQMTAAATGSALWYMSHWSALGDVSAANNLTWYRCAVRPATDTEVMAKKADAALNTPTTGVIARLGTEETTRANADSAVALRTSNLETSVNSGSNSLGNLRAAVNDEATARSNADSALATRSTSLEALSNSAPTNSINGNPMFNAWPAAQALPTGWEPWGGNGTYARASSESNAPGTNSVLMQANGNGNFALAATRLYGSAGWYVLEAEVYLQSGNYNGAGITLGGQLNLNFATDPDINETVSETGPARRKFSKLMLSPGFDNLALHPMANWDGFGRGFVAKNIYFNRCSVRIASEGEIKARKADIALNTPTTGLLARMGTEETTRSNADAALASRATTLESRTIGGGNMLTNTDFLSASSSVVADGWTPMSAAPAAPVFGINIAGDTWHLPGENALSIFQSGQAGASGYTGYQSNRFAVTPGTYIQAHCLMATHRCLSELIIYWTDANFNTVTASVSGAQGGSGADMNGGVNANAWRQQGILSVQVPSNAFGAFIELRKYNTNGGQSDSYTWFTRPYVGMARANTTEWTPFSPGSAKAGIAASLARQATEESTRAGADSALSTRATNLESTVNTGPDRNGALRASITDEATTRSNSDSALATRASNLEATVNTGANRNTALRSSIADEATARTNADSALATRTSSLETNFSRVPETWTVKAAGNAASRPTGFNDVGVYNPAGSKWGGYARSYTVVVFAAGSNTVESTNSYDVYGNGEVKYNGGDASANNSQAMANLLNNVAAGKTVIVYTSDEPASLRHQNGLLDAMRRCGAGERYESDNFKSHSAYILIGRAGVGRGGGLEYYAGTTDGSAQSWLEIPFTLVNGRTEMGGQYAVTSTASKLSDEATTRSNADSALANRTSSLESSVNNGGNSLAALRASINDEASTRANADSAVAARTSFLETTATATAGTNIVSNDKFAIWRDFQPNPDNWVQWAGEGSYRVERSAGIKGSPYCIRSLNDTAEVNSGFVQTIRITPGKWVMEATVESDGSGFRGAGLTLSGIYSMDFCAVPDISGAVGDKGNSIRSYSMIFDVSHDQNLSFHCMHGWSGFGRGMAAKYMKWHAVSLRPAGPGDIAGVKNASEIATTNVRIGNEETARANADSALGSRTNTLESNYGTVRNNLDAWNNDRYQDYLRVNSRVATEETTRANAVSALATRTTTLEASTTSAGNLVPNSELLNNGEGWTQFTTGSGASYDYIGLNGPDSSWQPNNVNTFMVHQGARSGNGSDPAFVRFSPHFSVEGGKQYQFYVYCATHRCNIETRIEWKDSAGNYINTNWSGRADVRDGGTNLNQWDRVGIMSVTAPGNATQALVLIYKWDTDPGQADSWAWYCQPYCGEAKVGQNQWNPYTPGSAKNVLSRVDARIATEETVRANAVQSVANRTASLESRAGGVEVRVGTTESAISNLNGRAAAYWQVQAVAGSNRAQLTVRADANGGGGVDIVGDVNFSGNLNVGPDSGGNRMKLTNSGLWLYDANGTLRAQLSL